MANEQVGVKLTLDANDGIKSLKDLKNQIKEAKGDLIAMADKFGETSEQARAAAKRVAELEDAIGDSKTLIDQFNPDKKFNAFAQSINGVLGGFSALQGAMGLLGVESEDLQKQLLKVQSAMALSQGLNQVGESINSFKNFGKTIIDTLGRNGAIGVAIAGVAALSAYVYELASSSDSAKKAQDDLNKAMKEAGESAFGEVGRVKELYSITQDATQSITNRKNATEQLTGIVKDINEKTGENNKLTKDQNGILTAQPDLIDKVSAALIRQAKTKAALSLIEEAYSNLLKAQSATLSSQTNKLEDFAIKTSNVITGFFSGGKVGINLQEVQKAAKQKGVNDAETYLKSLQDTFNSGLKSGEFKLDISSVATGGKSATASSANGEDIFAEAAKRNKLRQEAELADLERKAMMDKHMRSRVLITDQNSKIIKLNVGLHSQLKQLDRARTENENYNAEQRQLMAEQEAAARIQAAQSVGNAFGALADLLGRQTAAGKALAIAQATINMWVGVTEVLRAKSTLPEPLGTISKIANVAAIVATGINAIKNISKTKVPGGGGGGGTAATSPTVNAPLTPQIGVTSTQLNQSQLNRLGNATTRAYVVESDVSGNQERIRRLNRAARLG